MKKEIIWIIVGTIFGLLCILIQNAYARTVNIDSPIHLVDSSDDGGINKYYSASMKII